MHIKTNHMWCPHERTNVGEHLSVRGGGGVAGQVRVAGAALVVLFGQREGGGTTQCVVSTRTAQLWH